MKKILLMFSILFVLAACGSTNSTNEDSTSGDETSDQTEGDQNMSVVDQLNFSTEITESDDKATFNMVLQNESDQDVELTFSSGQKFDIIVTDPETNEKVYQFSEGQMFTQAVTTETLKANDSLSWKTSWDYQSGGTILEGKTYDVTVKLLPSKINSESVEADTFVKKSTIDVPAKEQANQTSNDHFRNIKVKGENGEYTITGEARVFEGVFHYTVEDGHHVYVEEEQVQTAGAPEWGTFEIQVSIDEEKLPDYGVLMLVLYFYDAKDGNRAGELPVVLENFNQ